MRAALYYKSRLKHINRKNIDFKNKWFVIIFPHTGYINRTKATYPTGRNNILVYYRLLSMHNLV